MDKYIEKEAVCAACNGGKKARLCHVDCILHEVPAADVVEVVRCKDCRNSMLWRKPTDTVIGECLIRKMHSEDEEFCQVGADDFCSYGERRGDE